MPPTLHKDAKTVGITMQNSWDNNVTPLSTSAINRKHFVCVFNLIFPLFCITVILIALKIAIYTTRK